MTVIFARAKAVVLLFFKESRGGPATAGLVDLCLLVSFLI